MNNNDDSELGDEFDYEVLTRIAELCAEIGWDIAIPTNEETVPGLIIGTEEFLAEMGSNYEEVLKKFRTDEKLH